MHGTMNIKYDDDDDDDDIDDDDDDEDEYFCLHSHKPTDCGTTTPFVGRVSRVPSQWQESPKHDTKHPHDHNATVLQTFASSTLPLATLPAKSYVSEPVTKTKPSTINCILRLSPLLCKTFYMFQLFI